MSAVDPAQHQILDRVEAHHLESNGISYGAVDLLPPEVLHQSQHLDEVSLSSIAHPGLQPPPQYGELLGQLPPNQWLRLVESLRLLLQ